MITVKESLILLCLLGLSFIIQSCPGLSQNSTLITIIIFIIIYYIIIILLLLSLLFIQ